MGTAISALVHGVMGTVAAGPGPRRASSRRTDIPDRSGRPLVTGSLPDHTAGAHAHPGVPVLVRAATPATPFAFHTAPRRRMGTVPKLAPGHQGSGLGRPAMAGFVSAEYPGFTPMDYAPATQHDRGIAIPQKSPVPWVNGRQLAPSWNAHDFAPARYTFCMGRSSALWAQASFPPQIRALTPSQQAPMLRRPAMFARRQIPAGQPNPTLYTAGYPTAVGIAARLGGGPIAVLGGNSQ